MSDFREELSHLIWREKQKRNTMRNLVEEVGISHGVIEKMLYKYGDLRLGMVLAVLDATGYELVIRKKEESQ